LAADVELITPDDLAAARRTPTNNKTSLQERDKNVTERIFRFGSST
jgi:hypothetical protein